MSLFVGAVQLSNSGIWLPLRAFAISPHIILHQTYLNGRVDVIKPKNPSERNSKQSPINLEEDHIMLSLGRIVLGRKLTTSTLQSIVIARPFTTIEFKPKLGKRDPEQKKEAVVATKKFDELNPGVFKDFTAKITYDGRTS